MKKLLIAFSLFVAMAFTTSSVKAQITGDQVNTAVGNLVALQGVNVNVTDLDVITIGDITVTDVVDITDVLNDLTIQDIQILTNFLNNIKIDNVLNNLLRDAEIITGNQVVVGILNGVLLVADKTSLKTNKK